MALTILVSCGVAFTPVFSSIKPGREFTSGNEIVYQIRETENTEGELDNKIADKVAAEMRNRLETYKIEDYSVRVEGNDTVRVSLSVQSETELTYISKYLSFNGKNFSLAGAEEETRVFGDKIFVDSEAYILRKQDIIPYVIFPVSDTSAVKTLIESVKKEETSEKIRLEAGDHDHGEEGEEESTPDIFLWANWTDGDTYEIATKDAAVTKEKIICSFVSSAIWYNDNLKEGEEPTAIQFLCGFSDNSGNYDTTKLREANELATYICNVFNASSYTFSNKSYTVENLFVTQSSSGVVNNNIKTNATAENLLVFGSNVNVAWSTTLIATLVAVLVIFLILVVFHRIASLGIMAYSVGTTFVTYTIFTALGATFNIAAVVGGVLLAASTLVLSILYMHRLKDEVYKGRSLRKANQEAMRRLVMPSIDVAVVLAFSGLMIYLLGGHALKPLGIMLFFGAVMGLLMFQIIFRINMWLLTNATSMQDNYKLLNIDEKHVPNIMKEEKPTYVEPYEKTNFTKHKKPIAWITGLLAVASIAVITVFGITKGSPLNVSNSTKQTTQIYLSIRADKPTLSTEDSFKNKVLVNVLLNDKPLAYSNVDLVNRETYDYETDITTKYTYFVTSLNGTVAKSDVVKYKIGSDTETAETVSDAIYAIVADIEGTSSEEYITSEEKVSYETVVTPHQGYVALACSISLVGAALYFAFRFKPSRALAALTLGSVATVSSYGVLAMCRLQTTGITSLVMPIAVVVSLLLFILFFNKEREMFKENKGELTFDLRQQISKKAISYSATPILISVVLVAYLAVNYFGFGKIDFAMIFGGMIIAIALACLFTLVLLSPLSELFAKWLKKIKLPSFKLDRAKKHRIKLQNKPKTSEPEETVFIGIND